MVKAYTVLGNKINSFGGYREFYDYVLGDRETKKTSRYVTVNNVHTIMEGFQNPTYQRIINNSYLSVPDGKPLQIMGKLKGIKPTARLFGPSLMEKLIDWGRVDGVSHFFFGSSDATLANLRLAIESKYPGAKISGMVSPPFVPVEEWDNKTYLKLMNESGADFIWIGLGAPKQEQWMYQQQKNITHGLLFGIGAGFDYLAGHTKHAPDWMKNLSLEWVYRLTQEPKRLWKRYVTTIPPFLFFVSRELIRDAFGRKKL